MQSLILASIILLACLSTAGCTTTFTANAQFPRPLIETLPLTVAVYYDERFRTFEREGMSPRGARWTARLGTANIAAFDVLFDTLFAESYPVTSGEPVIEPFDADALLAPEMESFRLAKPGDFDRRYYTVWIEYRMRMVAPNGDLIADWLVSAYGTSLRRGLGDSEPMREATYVAMRDATATVAADFTKQPDIRKWLVEKKVIASEHETPPAGQSKSSDDPAAVPAEATHQTPEPVTGPVDSQNVTAFWR